MKQDAGNLQTGLEWLARTVAGCLDARFGKAGRFEPGRSVRSRMSSNLVTPKVSFRPRVTAALFSCGIISLLWYELRDSAAGVPGAGLPTAAQGNVRIAQYGSLSDIT